MSDRFKLTKASIKSKCLPPAPDELTAGGKPRLERFYWDTEQRGFGILVRSTSKSFILQKDVRGRSIRVTLGQLGEITLDQARDLASDAAYTMRKGENPNQQKREEAVRGVTLEQAIEWHQDAMRADDCAPRSISDVRYELERHVPDWLRRPLAEVTRNECATRHARITQRSGKYQANKVMRQFRAVYNTVDNRMDKDLPRCPVAKLKFNKERRRQEPIPWSRLAVWAQAIDSIENPIRRDLQFFTLFTGLRCADARTVRWEQVNLSDEPILLGNVEIPPGCIRRPKPKGGEDRAFTVPLSTAALDILRRRRADNCQMFPDDDGWAFPTRDMKGQITHVQEMKEKPKEPFGRMPSPHRLRDTFATAASEAGLETREVKLFMNHVATKGDVTDGYIRNSEEHLRIRIEQVAEFLCARLWPKEDLRVVPRSEAG